MYTQDLLDRYAQILREDEKRKEELYDQELQKYLEQERLKESQTREAFINAERDVYRQQRYASTYTSPTTKETFVNTEKQALPTTKESEPEKKPGFWKETAGVIYGGGIHDTIEQFLEAGRGIVRGWYNFTDKIGLGARPLNKAGEKKLQEYREFLNAVKVDHVPFNIENETDIGKAARRLVNFGTKYLIFKGAVSSPGALTGYAAEATASGAATFFEDPYEERVSNLVQEYPNLRNPITAYLAADPNDSEIEARFKNVLEDQLTGGIFELVGRFLVEPIFSFVKSVKLRRVLKAQEGGEQVVKVMDETLSNAQALMDLDEKLESIAKSLEKADSEEAVKAGLKEFTEVIEKNNEALEEATQAALKEADNISPRTTADILASQKKPRIIPEDLSNRTPEELDEIRDYALSRGQQGINEWLDALFAERIRGSRPRNLREALEVGDADAVSNYLSSLRKLLSDESGQISIEGFKDINPIAAGSIVGGTSGIFVDYNGDGKKDIEDIGLGLLYGFTTGAAIKYTGDIIAHNKQKAAAFKAFKEEKLAQFAQYEAKIKERLANPKLSDTTKLELKNNLDFLAQVKNHMDKVKNYEDYIKKVKNPKAKARLEKKLEPVVKVNDSSIDNFMNNLKSGDLHKSLEVNFDGIDSEEGIKALNEAVYESFAKEIAQARNGIQSWDATKELAADLGISSATVNEAFKGVQDLHGKALAARITLMASRNKLTSMIKEAVENGDDSAKTLLAIRRQIAIHAGLQAEVSGMKTEIGRALNSLKILSNTVEEYGPKEMQALLDELGGRENNLKAMQKFLDLDPVRQNIFARAFSERGFRKTINTINSIYINSLLWSPTTWIANTISNFITTGLTIADNAISEGISHGVRLFNPSFKGTLPGSTAAMIHGLQESCLDASKSAYRVLVTGSSEFADSLKSEASIFVKLPDWFTFGGRMVTAGDDFAKVMGKRMYLHKEAYSYGYERALSEGLKGRNLLIRAKEYAAEIVAAPSKELEERALTAAKELTFSNAIDPDRHVIATAGKSVQSFVNKAPIFRVFFPFTKTPTNIGVYISERTPILNMLGEKFWRILREGSQEERSLLAAQMGLTSMIGIGIWTLAEKGYVTGGGPKNKSAKQLSGWQPYSFKIGDKYYSYNRFDPLAGMFSIIADAYEIISELEENDEDTLNKIGWAVVVSSYKNLMSKTYLSNLSELIDCISSQDPDRFENLAGRISAGFVPGIVGGIERTIDPAYNETFEFYDSLKSKIPLLSDTLPPKRDIFGDPVGFGGDPTLNWLNPVNRSEVSQEPARVELGKLEHFNPGTVLARMKSIDGVELTPEQYDQYVLLMGQPLKEYLNELVQSEAWKQASDGDEDFPGTKQAMVKKAISHFKTQAKTKLLEANPELKQKILKRKQQKIEALLGEE